MTALLAILILLQIADGLTTWAILHHGGKELNPAVRWAMSKLGRGWGLITAKAWAIGLLFALYLIPLGTCAMIPLALLYGWVVANNVRVLIRLMAGKGEIK